MIAMRFPRDPETRARNAGRAPWLDTMMLPSLVVLAIVVGYPVVYAFLLSAQDYNLLSSESARFVGAANYRKLFADPTFRLALVNSAIYSFGSVAVSALLGLTLAFMTENLVGRGGRLVRALLLTPW